MPDGHEGGCEMLSHRHVGGAYHGYGHADMIVRMFMLFRYAQPCATSHQCGSNQLPDLQEIP